MELAKGVARGQSLKRGQLDIDRFFGKFEDHGVPVHRMVQARLTDPNSKPAPLHFALLKMFPTESIRLITTNFDMHFSSAARSYSGSCPPATPQRFRPAVIFQASATYMAM